MGITGCTCSDPHLSEVLLGEPHQAPYGISLDREGLQGLALLHPSGICVVHQWADVHTARGTACYSSTIHLQSPHKNCGKLAHNRLSIDAHLVHCHGILTTPFSSAYACLLQEANPTCSHMMAFEPVQHCSATRFEAFPHALAVHQGRAGQEIENQVTAPSGMCSEGSYKSSLILACRTNG